MRLSLALVAAAILLAVAFVIEAPALLVDRRIAAITDDRLRIAGAEGTLWNGSGDLVLLPSGYRRPLVWRIDAWPLFTRGEIRGSLTQARGSEDRTSFAFDNNAMAVHALRFSVPAEALLPTRIALPGYAFVGGTVDVRVDDFARTTDVLRAQIAIDWRDASVPGPRVDTRIALGDVHLELSGQGREVTGVLRNTGGDVEVLGNVNWPATTWPRVDATIKPRAGLRPESAAAIGAALSAIGRSDGRGGFRVAWAASER